MAISLFLLSLLSFHGPYLRPHTQELKFCYLSYAQLQAVSTFINQLGILEYKVYTTKVGVHGNLLFLGQPNLGIQIAFEYVEAPDQPPQLCQSIFFTLPSVNSDSSPRFPAQREGGGVGNFSGNEGHNYGNHESDMVSCNQVFF